MLIHFRLYTGWFTILPKIPAVKSAILIGVPLINCKINALTFVSYTLLCANLNGRNDKVSCKKNKHTIFSSNLSPIYHVLHNWRKIKDTTHKSINSCPKPEPTWCTATSSLSGSPPSRSIKELLFPLLPVELTPVFNNFTVWNTRWFAL